MRCVFWPTVHGAAIQCPAVGQSGLLNSGPLWHAAKISVFTSVPKGAFVTRTRMRLDWSSPRSFAWLKSREIRPSGPGRHRRCPPGWWRPRRRTAPLGQPCGRVRHWFPKRPAGRVCCGCDPHFAPLCRRLSRHRAICGRRICRAGHGERQTANGPVGRQSQAARHQPDAVCLPAPQQAAAGLGPASSVMAVGEILLARGALASCRELSGIGI